MTHRNLSPAEVDFFQQHGYLTIKNLLTADELEYYRQLYDDFLNGKLDTEGLRSDLSGETSGDAKIPEKITQIMRPSLIVEELVEKALHQRALHIAQQLLGEDMDMDFDMLIAKAPFTDKITPWHQDEAYWLDMPDKRAVSCWVALDPSTKENGCMWYVPGSHMEELRPHGQVGNKGALVCECNEEEAVAEELMPGSCTFHHGRTLHYSRGNSTATNRRAFIVNFRPAEMIAFERERGYDHTGERKAQK
jgi:phytanoyl-CoA hydroxylase